MKADELVVFKPLVPRGRGLFFTTEDTEENKILNPKSEYRNNDQNSNDKNSKQGCEEAF